jgi:hypothetical protein
MPPKRKEPWQLPAEPGLPDQPIGPFAAVDRDSPIATILLRFIGAVEPQLWPTSHSRPCIFV